MPRHLLQCQKCLLFACRVTLCISLVTGKETQHLDFRFCQCSSRCASLSPLGAERGSQAY